MILLEIAKVLGLVPAPLIDTFFSQIRSRALIEAQRVHLFDLLSDQQMSADRIAARLGYDAAGTKTLLEVLVIIGYLKRNGRGEYRNSRWARRWLVQSSADCVGNIVMHAETVWDRARFIEPVLRTGEPPFNFHDETPPEQYQHYMLANRDMARRLLPEYVRAVPLPVGATTLLDLGGAHGEFSAALVAAHPGLSATVFDLAPALEAAREMPQQNPRLRRLTYRAGDFFKDDFGSGWDLVLLNHVARVFSLENNRTLFQRVYDRLSPQGHFVITDHLLGFGKTHDMYGKLFSFNLFPVGGRCYEAREFEELLQAVGFGSVSVKKLSSSIGSVMITAKK
jgi:SAM-dependent methyltransferase